MVAFNSHSPHADAAGAATDRIPSVEAQHDATLVRRFKAGDAAAFTEIVVRHHAKALATAFARLRNHADAEEIAQDTFIRAHRALADFRGESSLATWLHRITVNLALNRYWYFFRRRRHVTQSLDCALGDDNPRTLADILPCDAPGPVREAMTREFTEVVDVCMEQLVPRQREILRLRNVLNSSYEEIAVALGINIGTVKSRIARARANLQGLIATACPDFSPSASRGAWLGAGHM